MLALLYLQALILNILHNLPLICNRYTHIFPNLICSPWILIPLTLIIMIAFLSFSVAIWALPHSISETASVFSICHIIIFSTREAPVVLSLPIASTSISLIRVWPPGLLGTLFAFKHKKRELSKNLHNWVALDPKLMDIITPAPLPLDCSINVSQVHLFDRVV